MIGLYKCEGIDCGDNDKSQRYDGVCDKDGCDMNPYREYKMQNSYYYYLPFILYFLCQR